MRRVSITTLGMALGALAVSAAGATGAVQRGAAVPAAYLNGKWCDSTNSWTTFDAATGVVNLPVGGTGQRVVGRYRLSGGAIIITGPQGAILNGTFRRIDANHMTMAFGPQSDTLRRC
jgi:hypothetical protein